MKTTLIALLDKTWPPEHSFVNGMLASEAASLPGLKVRLCVSRGIDNRQDVRRYKRATCIPCLHQRRGVGRLLNFFLALKLIRRLAKRERQRHHRVIIFVRNDPMLLFAASVLRHEIDRLVFQTSFPHENGSGNLIKRKIAKLLFSAADRKVDAITAVSPLGLARARKLFPHCMQAVPIPLLSDLPALNQTEASQARLTSGDESISFIYIGTHSRKRKLDTVLAGIVQAVDAGARGTFLFAGGSDRDIARLSSVKGVRNLIEKKVVTFKATIPRSQIPHLLADSHVGLSLIPPTNLYTELSPAKLAEYMGAGLAVIATRGIPVQEDIVTESAGGLLTEWSVDSIAEAIFALTKDVETLKTMMMNSRNYAREHLQYATFLGDFKQLLAVG